MKKQKRGRVAKPPTPQVRCNGCGCCCDPVLLPYTQAEARSFTNLSESNKRWVMEDLTPMHPREARRLAPWYFNPDKGLTGLTPEESIPFFFRCRWFDRETRSCLNYDNRPEVCSDYPKTNGVMILPGTALPDPCSFNVTIGVTPTPVDEYLARIRQPS